MVKPTTTGFTLLEALVALSIFLVALSLTVTLAINNFRWANLNQERNEETNQARRVQPILTRDLRLITRGAPGSFGLLANNEQNLTFYSDTDRDGQAEQIRYWLADRQLYRGVTEPATDDQYPSANENTEILATDVDNSATEPIFTYYGANYPLTAAALPYQIDTLPEIRLVDVWLRFDTTPQSSPDGYILNFQISPRNL